MDDPPGTWVAPESYLQSRLACEITHTVCPRCTAKLYPDVAPRLPDMPASSVDGSVWVLCASCKAVLNACVFEPLEDVLGDRLALRVIRSLCPQCTRQLQS